jgi:hypothetical protein
MAVAASACGGVDDAADAAAAAPYDSYALVMAVLNPTVLTTRNTHTAKKSMYQPAMSRTFFTLDTADFLSPPPVRDDSNGDSSLTVPHCKISICSSAPGGGAVAP